MSRLYIEMKNSKGEVVATTSPGGNLRMERTLISPSTALALAAWIIANFSSQKEEPK